MTLLLVKWLFLPQPALLWVKTIWGQTQLFYIEFHYVKLKSGFAGRMHKHHQFVLFLSILQV